MLVYIPPGNLRILMSVSFRLFPAKMLVLNLLKAWAGIYWVLITLVLHNRIFSFPLCFSVQFGPSAPSFRRYPLPVKSHIRTPEVTSLSAREEVRYRRKKNYLQKFVNIVLQSNKTRIKLSLLNTCKNCCIHWLAGADTVVLLQHHLWYYLLCPAVTEYKPLTAFCASVSWSILLD